jgi:hypothetical protein
MKIFAFICRLKGLARASLPDARAAAIFRASTSPKAAMSIDADDYLTKSVGRVACPMQRRGGPEAA